jgi:hypothetical protein
MNTKQTLSIQQQLGNVSEGLVALEQVLNDTPAFKSIVQDILLEELQRIAPQAYISRTFINARQPAMVDPEPTGALLDVFMQCLARGRAPQYEPSLYGVYDWRDSTQEQDRIAELDVETLGLLIGEVMASLAQRYPRVIDRHWAASPGKDARGRELAPRITALRHVYAELFWQELRAKVQVQGLMAAVEESFEVFVRGKSRAPAYRIELQLDNARFVTLDGCFVMRLSGQFDNQIRPDEDEWMILYTPANGVEVFRTPLLLQRALQQRLRDPDTRAKLLSALALDDAEVLGSAPQIAYLPSTGELFQVCTDSLLLTQRRDLAAHLRRLQEPGAKVQDILVAVAAVQRLHGVSRDARARMASLLALTAQHARPQWLKSASSTQQEVFASLERELLKGQVALHEAMGGLSSLQEYARGVVAEHLSAGEAQPVDPDSIWVTVKHVVPMGSRKIEHVERKTLTQLFMYGVHDDGGRYTLQLENFQHNPRLSVANIERAVRQFDLRLSFAAQRSQRLDTAPVKDAMREVLGQQIALSNYAAILQKHISPRAQDIVQRYLFGDSTMEAGSVAFRQAYRPLKDMMVFRAKAAAADHAFHVLYAPGAPTGQQWYEFADLNMLKRQFIKWGFEPQDRQFLISQSHAGDRADLIQGYLSLTESRPVFEESWWGGVTAQPWTGAPLLAAVQNLIDWDIAEEQVVTPDWYRQAAPVDRERFTRLNTEFKAIAQVAKTPLHIPTLSAFSRDLVMPALNDYLLRAGPHPLIDPDRVNVKLPGHDWMTLTQLFIQWQLWKANEPVTFAAIDHAPLGRLNAAAVTALINLMPGLKYEDYLRKHFLTSSDYALKAKLYCKTVQNEMLRAALTQKMQGSLSVERFNWLKGQIEDLDHERAHQPDPFQTGSAPQEGIHTLVLEGQRLEGAYTFGRRVAGRLEHLVYIPKAPDGLAFRPLETLTSGLKAYALGAHIVRLVRLANRPPVQRFVERCRSASGAALATPVLRDSYAVKHFRFEYESMILRLLYDVDHQTSTRGEIFWRHVLVGVELLVDVVSLLVPPVGVVASIVRITGAIVQGLIAYSLGDEDAGKAHLVSAWRGAIILYVGGVAGVGASTSAVGLLSRIKDIADIVSTASQVPVGVGYITALATPLLIQDSDTRISD